MFSYLVVYIDLMAFLLPFSTIGPIELAPAKLCPSTTLYQ